MPPSSAPSTSAAQARDPPFTPIQVTNESKLPDVKDDAQSPSLQPRTHHDEDEVKYDKEETF